MKSNSRRTRPRDLEREPGDIGGLVILVKIVELENLLKKLATSYAEQRKGGSSFGLGSLLGLRLGVLRRSRLTKV